MISSCPWTEMDMLRGVCLHVHVSLHKDMARDGRLTVHVQCVQSAGSHCGFPWMWTKLDPYRRTKLGLHWLLITSHWLFLITHHACRDMTERFVFHFNPKKYRVDLHLSIWQVWLRPITAHGASQVLWKPYYVPMATGSVSCRDRLCIRHVYWKQ